MINRYTSFEVAQVFYGYLDKRVPWEAFKRVYAEWIGAEQ
jgi:hypothetical protein